MPFKSDKQRRFLWSQKPEVAKQIAHKQSGGGVYSSGIYDDAAEWHNARLAGIPQHVGFVDDPDDITETALTNPDDPYGGKFVNPDRKAPTDRYTDLATYYTSKDRKMGRGEAELARMAEVNRKLKEEAAKRNFVLSDGSAPTKHKGTWFQEGGEVPMTDGRKPKKVTQKDRYGNQVTTEYESDTKPLDINSLVEMLFDKDISAGVPVSNVPVLGDVSFGFADAHPGAPKGSDTVPAWLTPGEFVVNREAMSDPAMAKTVEAINDKGRMMQKGGPAYMDEGGLLKNLWWLARNQDKVKAAEEARAARAARRQQEEAVPQPTWADIESLIQGAAQHKQGGGHAQPSFQEWLRDTGYDEELARGTVSEQGALLDYYDEFGAPPPAPEVPTPEAPAPVKSAVEAAAAPRPRPRPQAQGGVDWDIPLGSLGGIDFSTQGSYTAMDQAKDPYKVGLRAALKFNEGGNVPVPMSPTEALLRAREGYRSDVYLDSEGKPTVGHGHLLPNEYISREGERPFSEEKLDDWFREDQAKAAAAAQRNAKHYGVDWDKLNKREKTALESMAFQLGETGQKGFEKMWKALAAGDKETASLEALDSDWASQTPERAKDVYSAFTPGLGFEKGGPVYAYRGYDVAEQDAYDIEDPNTDLSSGWTPPVVPETGEWDAGDEQLMQNYEMLEPPVPAGPDSDLGTSTAPHLERGLFSPADTGFSGATLGDTEEIPPKEESSIWDDFLAWAGDTSVADARNAAFNVKLEQANVEAEEANLAEMEETQARLASDETIPGVGPSDAAIEAQKAVVAHQQEKLNEARQEVGDIDYEGVVAEEAELMAKALAEQSNAPGSEDDEVTLEGLANSQEYEKEDNPAKPSEKGQQHPDEVISEGEKAAAEDPSMVEKATGFFKGAFDDLFDEKELARMAIMYMGSRALGYSHGGSLNWAAKQYVSRLDAKETAASSAAALRQKQAFELAKTDKFSPASVKNYERTGDLSNLVPKEAASSFKPNGNVISKWIEGKKVNVIEGKLADGSTGYTINGQLVSNQKLANAPDFDEGLHDKNSSAYKARRNDVINQSVGRFEEIAARADAIPNEDGTRTVGTHTNIGPQQAASEFFAWAEQNGYDAGSNEMQEILGNAYQNAIEESANTKDYKASTLRPYLDQQMIRERTTRDDLFQTGNDKNGRPTYVRADLMSKLDNNLRFIGSNFPTPVGLDTMYQVGIGEWENLSAADKADFEEGARKAGEGETGFYKFMNKRMPEIARKMLEKQQQQ